MQCSTSNSFALDIVILMPLALNEPVKLEDSSFIDKQEKPYLPAILFKVNNQVIPSPRLITLRSFVTGRISSYRHILCCRS